MIATVLLLILMAIMLLGLAAISSWQIILVVAIFVTAIRFLKRIFKKS